MTVTRTIMRYHGGKWRLAPWIVSHMPQHRVYVEPYGGAASVLLRKPRSYAEVYNDLSGEIVNVFEVARDYGDELLRLIALTPFSRREYLRAYDPTDNKVEWARRVIARSFMGFGSGSVTCKGSGFRANSNRSGTTPAHDWANYPDGLRTVIERLQGVVIENKCALEVMKAHDRPDTLHYVDPPYVLSTRGASNRRVYHHEMNDQDHKRLLQFLAQLQGMVLLSGYDSDIYSGLLQGWTKYTKACHADGARTRVECLWVNPAAERKDMFA